jgi:hypothetical protein
MSTKKMPEMTVEELVMAYADIVTQQDEAFKNTCIAEFTKLYWQRDAIKEELKSRPGDQREMLAALFKSKKSWVRICVARDTFALDEARARMHIQYVIDHSWDPYRGEARSVLGAWDRGFRSS